LTVLDNQVLVKTVRDVGAMPFAGFATVYAVSMMQTPREIFMRTLSASG